MSGEPGEGGASGNGTSGGAGSGNGGTAGNGGTSGNLGESGNSSGGLSGTAGTSGQTSAGAGGSPSGGASGSGGTGAGAAGGASISGPCVPTNPCDVGMLDSSSGAAACVDTQVKLPVGTACGPGSVCTTAGSCQIVACTFVPANLPNCVADKPCHIGHCDTPPTCSDLTVILNFGFAGDGTACGVPNKIGVCQQGDCVVQNCLPNGVACDLACVGPSGTPLKEGSRCGSNLVCLAGKCATELAMEAAPFTFVAGTPFSAVVAQVTDENLTDTAATLSAKITRSDGSTSIGTVAGAAGSFTVSDTHTYATGTYQVSVAVTDVLTDASVSTTFGVSDHIVEFPLPGTGLRPHAITLGKDGNIWFGLQDQLGRISQTGSGFTTFSIPHTLSSESLGVAAAADGSMWFSQDRDNQVGRLTAAGAITRFPVPTANGSPGVITQGADGNLWFLEDIGNVARITPAGVITEFSVGDHVFYSGGQAICLGPDQNIWFTEYSNNKVGVITNAGAITDYAIPTADSFPIAITAGPDGNLWFIETGGNNVGRITTSGVITEFSTNPTSPTATLANITSGPDGNLWVIEDNFNHIDRVTTSGVITRYDIPTPNSQSAGITSSATALWFSEGFAGKIARFTP
jgi:virginiamycin B lyase